MPLLATLRTHVTAFYVFLLLHCLVITIPKLSHQPPMVSHLVTQVQDNMHMGYM